MKRLNSKKGFSIIESVVCLVIIGIGFIAVNQLITFSIASMDQSMERTKVNFLSEMVIEDMIGDVNNASSYVFNEQCLHSAGGTSNLSDKQKNKWNIPQIAQDVLKNLEKQVIEEKRRKG